MSVEDRINELEARVAFQEDALQSLGDELFQQLRRVERLTAQVEALAKRQRELQGLLPAGEQEDEPPPPHD